MQTNTGSYIVSFAVVIALLASTIAISAYAQRTPLEPLTTPGTGGNYDTSPSNGGIKNPLEGSADSITDVLKKVINWMLGLVGFLALIAIIIGGGRMIINFGNEDQVKKAKTTILWAVIGLAVVILSYAIINIVTSEILGSGGSTPKQSQPPILK